ncbi:MAG: hypothetical protein LBJ11_03830 [Oscillospiraceae bacterium]|nr:hypothetical protein [Oscillospiraceae bacterium]
MLQAAKQTCRSLESVGREAVRLGIFGVELDRRERKPGVDSFLRATGLCGWFDFAHGADAAEAFLLVDTACRLEAHNVLIVPGLFPPGR